jgi:succinate-acetate transporter protein
MPAETTTPEVHVPPAAGAEPATPAADPTILGIPTFTLGALALGLAFVGYIPAAAVGGVLPIVFAATGLGSFVSAIWAMALRQTVFVGILGLFAGFWWSYAALVLGLTHGWYAVPSANVAHVQALFLIAWTAIFFVLLMGTLRLPAIYTALLALVVVAFVLLIIGILSPSTTATKAGGAVALAIAALGAYLFVHAFELALGGRALPLGRPTIR